MASSETIRCPECAAQLGERIGDLVIIRHRGRTVVAVGLLVVGCDQRDCRGVWRNPELKVFDGFATLVTDVLKREAERRERDKIVPSSAA